MKPFTLITVAVLAVVALLQALRVLMAWPVTIGSLSIPMGASVVACIVALGLSIMVWRENRP